MLEKAMFGAGCFWGVETAFRELDGVVEVAVGYSGGETREPTYEQVCSADTGHAEVVEVTFDPEKISYAQLVERFWDIHDPTQMNRQGPDFGTQYRTAIFYYDDDQRRIAEESKERAEPRFRKPIATEITSASDFWRAEDYHQRYFEKRGIVAH